MSNVKKVLVLRGGWSRERDVSLVSGENIIKALKKKKYQVVDFDPDKNITSLLKIVEKEKPDVIFNALHGIGGEDGVLQSVLRLSDVPFTHSGVVASAVAMDKRMTKNVARGIGIPVAEDIEVKKDSLQNQMHPMPLPYVLKPVRDGSSMHIYIVNSDDDLKKALHQIPDDLMMMAEPFIKGRELTVSVLQFDPDRPPNALGITELKPKNEFYDYEAKYTDGVTEHDMDPVLPKEVAGQILNHALKMHLSLVCRGVSRSDFRYNEEDGAIFLEINTQPGFTPLSLTPEQAKANGLEFNDLVEQLMLSAVTWHKSRPYYAEIALGDK